MEIFRKYPALKWLLLWGGILVLVVIGVHFFAKTGTSSSSTTGPTTDPNATGTELGIAPTSSFNQNITVAGASGVGASGGGGSGSPGGSGGAGGSGGSGGTVGKTGGGHPGPGPHNPVDPLPGPGGKFPAPGSWHPNVPYPAHGQITGVAQFGADARRAASQPAPKQVITTGHDARQAVHPQPARKAPGWLSRLPQRRLQGTQRSLNRMGG